MKKESEESAETGSISARMAARKARKIPKIEINEADSIEPPSSGLPNLKNINQQSRS